MKIKPWQLVVIVIGFLAALSVTVWNLTSGEDIKVPDNYFVVDVESGQIYRVNRNRVTLDLPAVNPETGRVSIVGLDKNDTGYYVNERDLSMLKMLGAGVKNNAVDEKTGALKNQNDSIVDYKKP